MSTKPSGTDAKEIALYFLELTEGRATPHVMARNIRQAKVIMESGYTKDEIKSVMKHIIVDRKVNVFSFGYFNTCMNDVLHALNPHGNQEEKQQIKESIQKEIASVQASQRNEVTADVESIRRNEEKTRRTGVQSGFGKKFNFDMFEGHGQDN